MNLEESHKMVLKIATRAIDSLQEDEPTILAMYGLLRAVIALDRAMVIGRREMSGEHQMHASELCANFLNSLSSLHEIYKDG